MDQNDGVESTNIKSERDTIFTGVVDSLVGSDTECGCLVCSVMKESQSHEMYGFSVYIEYRECKLVKEREKKKNLDTRNLE